MYVLVDKDNVVVQAFNAKPDLHASLMASVFQVNAEIGDVVMNGVNYGSAPTENHVLRGENWDNSEFLKQEILIEAEASKNSELIERIARKLEITQEELRSVFNV